MRVARGKKRPACEAASFSGGVVYAIQCSRESKLVCIDEGTYEDLWGEETNCALKVRDAAADVESAAGAGDGTWFYDAGGWRQRGFCFTGGRWLRQNSQQGSGGNGGCNQEGDMPGGRVTPRQRRADSDSGPEPELLLFSSLQGANARAEQVWEEMRRNYPFDGRASDGDRKEEGRTVRRGMGPKVDERVKRTVSADGRVRWRQTERFYCDPWGCTLKNVVHSTATVEVVAARLLQ